MWAVSSLVTVSFAVQKVFSLMQSHFSLFLLDAEPFEFCLESHSCNYLFHCFSYCFLELLQSIRLLLRSLMYFELNLVQGERQGSSFSFLHVNTQFSQQHLLKRLSFLHHMFWAPLSKISWL
jgi:hypothetical protein